MNAETTTPMSRHRLIRWAATGALTIAVVLLVVAGVLWQAGFDAHLWRQVRDFGVLLAVMGVLWLACLPFTSREPMRLPQWRYERIALPAMLVQLIGVFVVASIDKLGLPTWAMTLIALLPVVPMFWVAFALWRLMREGDELERRIQLESVFITCGVIGLAAFAAGMLEIADVIHLDGGLFFVLPGMFVLYGVANWWCRRQYGMRGCG